MIWFLRHADSMGQAPDAALSAEGAQAAEMLVPVLLGLPINRIHSSPYRRALDTAAPFAAAAQISVHEDERLRERVHGAVPPGGCGEEIEHLFADFEARPHGGESLSDVAQRGQAAVAEIAGGGEGALIATHGLWLSVILSAYGRPLDIPSWRSMPRPALFELHNGRVRSIEVAP
ncbi:MAG: histidine phosphatase family protein [Pseudomonadota bacterium]